MENKNSSLISEKLLENNREDNDLNSKQSKNLKGSNIRGVSASLTPKNAYAIVIGISDYPGSSYDLSYCDDDAQEVYSLLINDFNFKPENVYYLHDSAASKSAIDSAFDQIASVITSNDVFFFYYSGHGGFGIEEGPYSWTVRTSHPYPNYYDRVWSVGHSGAAYMRVHFNRFSCEYGYDYALCGDSSVQSGWYYELLTGNLGYNFWSSYIPVDRYYIRFVSDYSIIDYGFDIDKYEAITNDNVHYLCTFNSLPSYPSNYYLDTLLDSKLDLLNCSEKYVILDSCHSGGLIPEVQDVGRYIMTACEADEFSLEDDGCDHGVFTYNFLESFESATDSNDDGVKSFEECYSYTYSNTVSHSSSLGYTHHPQQYDGISGESILQTSFSSVSLTPNGATLSYSFKLHGIGQIKKLLVGVFSNSSTVLYNTTDLTIFNSTATGFDEYSGTIHLQGVSSLIGYGIYAKIQSYNILIIKDLINFEFDTDGDGLKDYEEVFEFTSNPGALDTDNDQIPDGYECHNGLNPCENDANLDNDDDGLINIEEYEIGSNASNDDTDFDGMPDGWEYSNGLELLFNDSSLDADEDGLSNLLEYEIGSHPRIIDSDRDGMPDGWEYEHGLNLKFDDAKDDLDTDCLSNYLEYLSGSNPEFNDTDNDGMPDGWEFSFGLNLKEDDSDLDPDNDALSNLNEYLIGTNPKIADTDGDLFSDGVEVKHGGNPLDPLSVPPFHILNLAGIALISITIFISYHIYENKILPNKKFTNKFKIKKGIEIYNAFKETTIKMKPRPTISPYKPSTSTTPRATNYHSEDKLKKIIFDVNKEDISNDYIIGNVKFCKACGTLNRINNKFCINCGRKLNGN
ncbi:MAG: caspase family protein [Promethearchaeota archaeon]